MQLNWGDWMVKIIFLFQICGNFPHIILKKTYGEEKGLSEYFKWVGGLSMIDIKYKVLKLKGGWVILCSENLQSKKSPNLE